jgi:fibronectin-binding autotransporter adhesin
VVAAAAAALSVVVGSAPAQASLVGATVQTASYLDVPFPPPAASPTECTIIDCNILDYQGPSGPTNSPLPIVPVTYVEDSLTLTTVSVGDTQITITNDFAGLFCPSRGCTPGDFSGYVFTFTGAPDITNVEVGSGSSLDFQPVAPPTGGVTPGLTWTTNSITVNVAGDNLAVGDQLILDVTSGSFSFTRTVSGNWTDATGWTPNGVPNGATVTAQLVNPASGTNNVNLGGGTFTVNQLQFSGTNAGTWDVTNGTIVFDGTNPTFLNQGDSSGLAGTLPNLTLNATTTFEIDNASALTDVIGDITGAGGLIKTGAGTLTLTGANTYAGGTTISAGTLQIGNGGTTGSIVGNVTDNAALAFDRSDGVTFGGVISGTGSLTQLGAGTLTLTGANTYTGGTTISAGTLQIGNGGAAGSIVGNVLDNGVLAFDRSDNVTFGGVVGGTGSLTQLGGGTLILTGANTYGGATTIAAGTLALAGAGSIASSSGVADNGTFDISGTTSGASIATLSGSGGVTLGSKTLTLTNQSSTFAGVIGGAGGLTLTGAGTETLTGTNTYTGGTTIGAGTLQIGNGGTTGSIAGNVADNGALTFDRSDNVSYGGVVSGTGSLTQLGAGTLTLTGVNTYTGNTAIGSGSTLQIGGAGSLGSGSYAGNITDNGTFEYSSSAAQTLSGVISGAGALAQNGTGTLILTGVNTYTGNTAIGSGSTLQIGGAGSLGSGSYAGNVTDNGTFEDSSSATQTLSGVISGAGALAQNGTGTLILTGVNTYAGGTFLDAGTLGIDSNGDLGAGPLVMQPGTTLRFEASGLNLPNTIVLRNADPTIDTGANTDTISGVISGPGSLAKIGSGTLILSAANTYAGATDVQAGTLAVTGSIVSSATVESGATLGGSGTIGGLVAKSAATIAPGVLAPFSTLTVNGAASFAAGSIFAVNVNAAGQNDKLVTTGSTTIAGGTVQVTPVPGTYAPQTRYTLITAGGGVSGTFSALTGLSSLAFLTPALSYDPDDVFLGFTEKTVTTPPLLFPSVAQTPNQIATATALSAQPMGSPLFNAVIGQTVPGALAAFDALSGEVHASAVSAAFDDQRLPREAVFDRLATPYGAALAGGAQSVQTLAAPNPAQVFAAWGQAFDSWGHIGGDGNAATLSNNLGGLIFGADATLQGRYRLGVAGGYDYSTLGLGARGSSGNVSTTYVGLYGGLSDGALQLRGGGFYGYNHYGTNRTAVFPGFADTLGSGYGGDTWQAFAEAGWRTPVGGLAAYSAWAEPFVGLTGLEIATRSFGESAGAAALNGASAAYDFGITTLGLRGEASLFAWAPLVANGMIGWQRAFGDVTPNSVLAFASAPDVPFAIAGAPIARNALAVEAGADWRFTANVKIGIYYSGLIASNASDNAIKVKLEANF